MFAVILVCLGCGNQSQAQLGPVVGWGDNSFGQASPPAGDFRAVSAGAFLSAGIRPDGTLAAWGVDFFGQLNVPSGSFLSVDVGGVVDHAYGLAVREDRTVAGWGSNISSAISNIPSGQFQSVSAGGVAVGLLMDGTLAGWGPAEHPIYNVPGGSFVAVSAGNDAALALRADGSLEAWGISPPTMPPGTYTAIEAGPDFFLGIKTDGTISGWSANFISIVINIPAGQFVSVKAGGRHAIAMRADGTLVGWGMNLAGQLNVPPGSFAAIAAGDTHSLALVPAPGSTALLGIGAMLFGRRRRSSEPYLDALAGDVLESRG